MHVGCNIEQQTEVVDRWDGGTLDDSASCTVL